MKFVSGSYLNVRFIGGTCCTEVSWVLQVVRLLKVEVSACCDI